jgi:glutaredoxin-like protein NrdH
MFEYIEFERRKGKISSDDIKLFGLSTCGFCKRAIDYLDHNDIEYDLVFLDEIDIKLKIRAKEEFQIRFKERMSLPTLVFNEEDYQIGFIRIAWEKMFSKNTNTSNNNISNLKNDVSEISKFVEASAKYKNWFINPDKKFRQNLEEGLLVNFKRYSFYHCPCRDSDSILNNRDIACPCKYAEKDIIEWGQCFCGLFVSKEIYEAGIELGSIPERRQQGDN